MVWRGHDRMAVRGNPQTFVHTIVGCTPADTNVRIARAEQCEHVLAITNLELDWDLRVRLAKSAQQRRQHKLGSRINSSNANGCLLFRGGTVRHPRALFEQTESLARMWQEDFSRGA